MLLNSKRRPDCIIWEHEKSGIFSVKSAYDLFQKQSKQDGECSNAKDQSKLWRKLWQMNVPNKVKIFA